MTFTSLQFVAFAAVAALPGGSPLTGLAVIEASPALRPRVIAVETNILNRGIDDKLFRRFKDATRPDDRLRPLRSLAAYYQSVRDDALTYDAALRRSILERPPPPMTPNGAWRMPWWSGTSRFAARRS